VRLYQLMRWRSAMKSGPNIGMSPSIRAAACVLRSETGIVFIGRFDWTTEPQDGPE